MKKIISIISALAIMAGALFMTGCDGVNLTAPEDEWCEKALSYDISESSTANLTVYFYYATAEKEVTMGYTKDSSGNVTENKQTLKKGLNLVLVGTESSSTEDSLFGTVTNGKKPLYFKTLEEGKSTAVETDDGEKSLTMGSGIWNIIYFLNKMDDEGSTPAFAKKTDDLYKSYESISSMTENFSFSKLLKKIALNKLTDLLTDDSTSSN